MAIDTADKRASALDYEEVWAESIPIPDATVAQIDRQFLLWSYTGLSAFFPTGHTPASTVRGRGLATTVRGRGLATTVRGR